MEKKQKPSSWKRKNFQLWERVASTYIATKTSPSIKRILKLIFLLLKLLCSVIIKMIIEHFFPDLF